MVHEHGPLSGAVLATTIPGVINEVLLVLLLTCTEYQIHV